MQAVLVRISARLLKKTLTHTDERAKLEGELLDGVDVVKCMTWEVMPPAPCLCMCALPISTCGHLMSMHMGAASNDACVQLQYRRISTKITIML